VTGSSNLDLVRSIHAAAERGDFRSAEWADPDIELVFADGPEPGVWRGVAGMAEGMRDWLTAWEDFRFAADEYREIDDERVLVLVRLGGRGRASGLEVGDMRAQGAHVFHLSDGKVTRFVVYMDRGRALADLGLASEGGSP
jgi:ketosteroid isomerase-like protein